MGTDADERTDSENRVHGRAARDGGLCERHVMLAVVRAEVVRVADVRERAPLDHPVLDRRPLGPDDPCGQTVSKAVEGRNVLPLLGRVVLDEPVTQAGAVVSTVDVPSSSNSFSTHLSEHSAVGRSIPVVVPCAAWASDLGPLLTNPERRSQKRGEMLTRRGGAATLGLHCNFQFNPVVRRVDQILLRPKVALGRLH